MFTTCRQAVQNLFKTLGSMFITGVDPADSERSFEQNKYSVQAALQVLNSPLFTFFGTIVLFITDIWHIPRFISPGFGVFWDSEDSG